MSSITATFPLQAAQSDRGRAASDRARRRAEDLLLVDGILRGDEDSFRRLVERYERPLYWVAYDVLQDGEEARDAVQEAFIRVHGAIGRFDRRRDLMSWMYRIVRNLAIDAYRRRRRRALSVEDVEMTAAADGCDPVRPGTSSGGAAAAEPDLGDQVAGVLAELPIEYRMVLTLREFHGLTPREIASVTDCSYPTARWRLHRARKLFRRAWEARFEPAPADDATIAAEGSHE